MKLLTTQQAADILGYAPGTLRNWRQNGKGPPWRKLGRAVRYEREELERWANQQAKRAEYMLRNPENQGKGND